MTTPSPPPNALTLLTNVNVNVHGAPAASPASVPASSLAASLGHDAPTLDAVVAAAPPLKKKKPGRSPSQIWMLLTDEPNPQRKNAAACKHCKQQVLYYKKSEQAIRHLKKCTVFQSNQHQYSFIAQFQDILPLYQQKISQKTSSKKRLKAAQQAAQAAAAAQAAQGNANGLLDVQSAHAQVNAMNALAMPSMPDTLMDATSMAASLVKDDSKDKTTKERKAKNNTGGALSKAQQERMEEAVAMHVFASGMSFDVVEDAHLQRAMSSLRPSAKLPDRKRLETDLLQRCYEKVHKRVWSYLTATASTRVCIKRDSWSHLNLYNAGAPEDTFVTYMAVNSEKRLFLESEKVADDTQFNSILIAQDIKRVMAPMGSVVSGVVTASTEYHMRAWEMLKAEYPTKFFYGCILHAVHLVIKDIFGPEPSIENDPHRLTPQLPMDYPFQDLAEFTTNCNDLISFFVSYQYPAKFKMFDPQTLQTMKTFSMTSSPMQWDSLSQRFRLLLQTEDVFQSIVTDPDFVTAAPVNQRATRQTIKDFVMNLNWKITLERALNILLPFDVILTKFEDDKTPISDVYFESKHLLSGFEVVFGLGPAEFEYIKKVVSERWHYVLGEAHALAFLLDPRYIGKSMSHENREQFEERIFSFPETDADVAGQNDERKRAMSAEYTDYVIYAKNLRANGTFKWEMLDKGTRSPLQFWQTEAYQWPHLRQLALTLFSLAPTSISSEQSLCKSSLLQSSRNNDTLSIDDMRRLAFITINDGSFAKKRTGDAQNSLPDLSSLGDAGLTADGMMTMWMI